MAGLLRPYDSVHAWVIFWVCVVFSSCFTLCREIVQPRDMITIPADDRTFMHFCGQFCLSVFRHKKKQTDKVPDKWADKQVERKPEKPPEKPAELQTDRPFCSVCKVSNKVKDFTCVTWRSNFRSASLHFGCIYCFSTFWLWSSLQPIEHEVTHQGRLHRLCSDACFVTWRKIRQLAMNCCEGCGLYCNTKSGSCQTLTIEKSQLNFCGPTCISTYKQV